MGAYVTRNGKTYYKADDGKLYQTYNQAVQANQGRGSASVGLGGVGGLFRAAGDIWKQADRAAGGWLPGGGTASPATRAVQQSIRPELRSDISQGVHNLATAFLGATAKMPIWRAGMYMVNRESPTSTVSQAKEITRDISGTLKQPVGFAVAVPGESSYFDPRLSLRTNGLTPSRSVVVEPQSAIFGRGLRIPNSTLMHELGHAKNYEDSFWGKVQRSRFTSPSPAASGASGILTAATRNENNPSSVFAAGMQGAIANMLTPRELPTLAEEAAASIRGANIARRGNIPISSRHLIGAWGTYAARPATSGFAEGALAEAGMQGIDWLRDRLSDFSADRRPPNKLEQELAKYGFDKDQYRLQSQRTPIGYDQNTLNIERR